MSARLDSFPRSCCICSDSWYLGNGEEGDVWGNGWFGWRFFSAFFFFFFPCLVTGKNAGLIHIQSLELRSSANVFNSYYLKF